MGKTQWLLTGLTFPRYRHFVNGKWSQMPQSFHCIDKWNNFIWKRNKCSWKCNQDWWIQWNYISRDSQWGFIVLFLFSNFFLSSSEIIHGFAFNLLPAEKREVFRKFVHILDSRLSNCLEFSKSFFALIIKVFLVSGQTKRINNFCYRLLWQISKKVFWEKYLLHVAAGECPSLDLYYRGP